MDIANRFLLAVTRHEKLVGVGSDPARAVAISVTVEQALALAPDASSAKSARSLAVLRPWSNLGQDGRSIWGECQGSGKDPYRAQIDWEGLAFKCSCPSRKFPCKHGLALLLLLAEHGNAVVPGEPPDWVATWIASRTQRAEAKASKDASAPVDEAAQAKRAEQRASRIAEGLDVLELWLRDLVQTGLASSASRDFPFWDQQAARLVDAQAPGAARRVRNLAGIALSGEGWQDRMLAAIGRLVLLVHAYRRLDQLDPSTQADVKTAVGLPVAQEAVLAMPPVRDLWLVAGQRVAQEDRLRVQRTWLLGLQSGSQALILDFAHGASGFKSNLLAGSVVDGDLCFFPGASPLRALVKEICDELRAPERPLPAVEVAEAYATFGARLAANPWIENQPALLRGVVPVPGDRQWHLADSSGDAIPCEADDAMLALSGGRGVDVFVEWDGSSATPLLVADSQRIIGLREGAGA